jgi:hypothetical protein
LQGNAALWTTLSRWRVSLLARPSPLGVVLTENNVNLGNAFCSEVEVFNLLLGHANENFGQTGIGLLLREDCQFITQVFELLRVEPTLPFHESFSQGMI